MRIAGGCLNEAEKENVLIRTAESVRERIRAGKCTVALLPQFGGKIASICVGKRELLQGPLVEVAARTRTMPFDASDASGWDECLPSVAVCKVNTKSGVAEIPDHGDLWRVEWSKTGNREQGKETGDRDQGSGVRDQGNTDGDQGSGTRDQFISLRGECFSLPLVLVRSLALTETAKGWHLNLDYKLTNTGQISVPWSWAAHPLFAVVPGDTFELPASIAALRVENSGGGRLGVAGDRVSWPVVKRAKGRAVDLSVVQSRHTHVAEKLFAGPLAANENWCALRRPKAGLRVQFSFDPAATPYLGMWLCYGGWPERRGTKQMCVAFEPATAPVDSLAQSGDWVRVLEPGRSASWQMRVAIEIV